MKTKYRIINKSDNEVITKGHHYDVGSFLMGRRIDNYIIVKSDDQGDRLMKLDEDINLRELIESLASQ